MFGLTGQQVAQWGVTHERGTLHACLSLWELSTHLWPCPSDLRWGAASELVLWQAWSLSSKDGVAVVSPAL